MVGAASAPEVTSTLGIDLSSQPRNTGLCAIEWAQDHADVVAMLKGVDDEGTPLHDKLIVSAMRGLWGGLPAPSKVAIDAPLGWPVDFVQAVSGSAPWPVGIEVATQAVPAASRSGRHAQLSTPPAKAPPAHRASSNTEPSIASGGAGQAQRTGALLSKGHERELPVDQGR